MEELLKILNIKEINYLLIDYIDNHGNCKIIRIDHSSEISEISETEKQNLVEW